MKSPRAPRIVGDPSPDGNHAPGKRITRWPPRSVRPRRVHFHPQAACRIQEGQDFLLDAGEEGLASVLLLSGRERPTSTTPRADNQHTIWDRGRSST